MKTKCLHCGKEFDTKPSLIKRGEGKYCSRECAFNKARIGNIAKRCIICGNEFITSGRKDGRKTCSTECSKKRNLSNEAKKKISNKLKKNAFVCKYCGIEFEKETPRQKCCHNCKSILVSKDHLLRIGKLGGKATIAKQITTSKIEEKLGDIIKELVDRSISRSDKLTLNGLEIDILIDKLAIEYNGPWHYRQIMGNLGSIKNRDNYKQRKLKELGYHYHPVMWSLKNKDNINRLKHEAFFIIEKIKHLNGEITPFYFPFDLEAFKIEFNKLKKTNGRNFLCCIQTLEFYFKHLWFMKTSNNKINSIDHWKENKERVIENRSRYSSLSSRDLRRYYKLNYMAPTIFYDSLVKNIMSKYNGQIVIDPFAGFGSRMLGACASGKKYVGIDLNKETSNANNCLASDLGLDGHVKFGDSLKLSLEGDILITSPPYYNLDNYDVGMFKSKKEFLDFINAIFSNHKSQYYIIDYKDGEIGEKEFKKALPFKTITKKLQFGGGIRKSTHNLFLNRRFDD